MIRGRRRSRQSFFPAALIHNNPPTAACPFQQEPGPKSDDPSAFKFVLKAQVRFELPQAALGDKFFLCKRQPCHVATLPADTFLVASRVPSQPGWTGRQLEDLFLWFEAGAAKGGAAAMVSSCALRGWPRNCVHLLGSRPPSPPGPLSVRGHGVSPDIQPKAAGVGSPDCPNLRCADLPQSILRCRHKLLILLLSRERRAPLSARRPRHHVRGRRRRAAHPRPEPRRLPGPGHGPARAAAAHRAAGAQGSLVGPRRSARTPPSPFTSVHEALRRSLTAGVERRLWLWAKEEGHATSRDEAREIIGAGGQMPPHLQGEPPLGPRTGPSGKRLGANRGAARRPPPAQDRKSVV